LQSDKRQVFMVFIDYSKAFDCVDHSMLWHILEEMGFPLHIIHLIKNVYAEQSATVKTENGLCDFFRLGKDMRQGCVLSPYPFNIYGEYIMRGNSISELRYADDTTLIETAIELMQTLLNKIKKESEKVGLYLNKDKTKLMSYENVWVPLTISNISIYKSLGVWISNFILIYQKIDGHSNISEVKLGSLD
uniref:Reverse transcriptase domain-containing protein n=1 Tax=Cynoglossus semilaevis TaxID=244447 RepID=A0A3P8W241_CYNSE